MRLYKAADKKQLLRFARWHIINKATGFSFCGEDPTAPIKHIEQCASEDMPEDDRLCRDCVHGQNGYLVENVQYGQVRRYGPSVYKWHVTDLVGERTAEEVKAYCREHVRKAPGRGDPGYHSLSEHYQGFGQVPGRNHTYYYQTGHDWTG